MKPFVIHQLKTRRDELHRRIGELRAELKDVEARADEIERVWREALVRQDEEGGFELVPPGRSERTEMTAADLILYVLEEFERHGAEGANRLAVVEVLRGWSPKLKPNTIRVTFKRLIKKGQIEKVGNLYRPACEN